MRYALDTRTTPPTRIKATKTLESEDIEKGDIVCPNPHCRQPVYIKGNSLAPSRIKEREDRGEEECSIHVMPHWAHYEAPEGVLKYREQELLSHELGCMGVEHFLGIPDIDIELWYEGSNPEETVAPDAIFRHEFQTYAIEVQHSTLNTDEFERRQYAYHIHGLVPVWILHKKESLYTSLTRDEIGLGNFGRNVLYSKLERRLARRQGWVLYYELEPKEDEEEIDLDDPRVLITVRKYEKKEGKKQSYFVTEEYTISTIDEFKYILSKIKDRKIKYEDLRESDEFDDHIHYAFDEDSEEWYPHTKAFKCAETGKEVFFPINLQVPKDWVIPSVRNEVWNRTKPNYVKKQEWFKIEDQRWND